MAITLRNKLEGTNATTITTGNSGGSGSNALDVATENGGSTTTYSNQFPQNGTTGGKTIASSNSSFFQHAWTSTSIGAAKIDSFGRIGGVRIVANPISQQSILVLRNGGVGGSLRGAIAVKTDGHLVVVNAAGSGVQASASALLTDGTKYRIELRVHTDATTGQLELRYYLGDSTSPVETINLSNQNSGATGVDTCIFQYGPGGTNTVWYDDYGFSDVTWLGPGSNQAPTANAGVDQSVAPSQAVTLDFTGSSDPDGTISTYSVTQTAGPAVTLSGSGSSRTFTAPGVIGGTTLTFSLTVTDDGGLISSADTVNINVASPTFFGYKTGGAFINKIIYVRSSGAWIN